MIKNWRASFKALGHCCWYRQSFFCNLQKTTNGAFYPAGCNAVKTISIYHE